MDNNIGCVFVLVAYLFYFLPPPTPIHWVLWNEEEMARSRVSAMNNRNDNAYSAFIIEVIYSKGKLLERWATGGRVATAVL